MAVRRERVILDVTDNATPAFARMAAGAQVASSALDDLGSRSSRAGRDLDAPAQGAEKVSASSRRAGPEIDRLSGRLRLLADAAVTLGPALVPLGAATIPLLTGALAGLGAAAGGIGVAVLAFQGLGDAIKSIDEYRLEPTAANLAKVRAEAEKLGPAGASFARFIADLEPELRNLQMTARNGLFPGLENGIESILTRGPQVNAIVSDIARGMGDLARDAGASLGGEDFDNFFRYLETDARPILESFARSIGNVALGVANMLVGFSPATNDFTGGLERMTKSFANWSKGLEDNKGFQDFVSYVRESGPQAVQFLGAIAQAISGLLQAAAPLGNVVLPALTALARVFGAIGSSSIGPALYTAVAAFLAFNRTADLASRTMDRFKASSDKTTGSMSKFSALSAGIAGTAIAVGALADNINRIDAENLDRSLTALGQGDVTDTISKVVDSIGELSATRNKVDLGEIVTLGGLAGDSSLDKFADNVNQVDQALAQMVESGNADQAADLFTRIKTLAGGQGISTEETTKQFDAYALALKNAEGAARQASGGFTGLLDTLVATAGAARDLTGVLAALNGWFDKRDAVRAYKDSIDTLRESMKDGFSREDAANIDNIGRSILQVAENIKNPEAQANFLAGARQQLVDLAENSGPRAAAALQEVIDKFDDKNLTNPPPTKLSVDAKEADDAFAKSKRAAADAGRTKTQFKITADSSDADRKIGDVNLKLRRTGGLKVSPTLGAQDLASAIISGVLRALNGIDGKVATTYVRTIRQEFVNPQARASGGYISGPGTGTSDSIPARLSNGEYVLRAAAVKQYGVDVLNKMNTLGYANGGEVPRKGGGKAGDGNGRRHDSFLIFFEGMEEAGKGLKGLKASLDKAVEAQKKQVEDARAARDAAVARRDALSSGIQQGLAADPFADQERSSNVWAAGASAGGKATPQSALAALRDSTARARRLVAALNTLKQKGITGPVLAEIIGTGDVERAEMMAALDMGTLTEFSSAFTENQQTLAAAGLAGGNAVEAANIDATNKELRSQVKELKNVNHQLHSIEKAIERQDKNNQRGHKENAKEVKDGVNSAASGGRRRGNGGRR